MYTSTDLNLRDSDSRLGNKIGNFSKLPQVMLRSRWSWETQILHSGDGDMFYFTELTWLNLILQHFKVTAAILNNSCDSPPVLTLKKKIHKLCLSSYSLTTNDPEQLISISSSKRGVGQRNRVEQAVFLPWPACGRWKETHLRHPSP